MEVDVLPGHIFCPMSPKPALRHLGKRQVTISSMSLFLIACLIKARMGNKAICPSRTGDGVRYCRQYSKRRNSDVRHIDTSVACGLLDKGFDGHKYQFLAFV